MPIAKKLPSGSWRCQVFVGKIDGKNKYKSITVRDSSRAGKKECERLAAEYAVKHSDRGVNVSIYDAVKTYITAKEKVLSPSTVRSYDLYLKRMEQIDHIMIPAFTVAEAQQWVSTLSIKYSAKYIKNIYGLLSASIEYSGGHAPSVTFHGSPQAPVHAPCDADVQILLSHIKSRPALYTAVILAAFGGLRRGEICALTEKDIDGNRVSVTKSMVRDSVGIWHVKKTPKTDTSNRVVILPEEVMPFVTVPISIHPEQVSNRFRRAVKSCGCKTRFRFHDLRHYYVSIAHALGVPDAYIMQMGGWKTDNVMKRVYRDALPDIMKEEQKKLDDHFRTIFV